MQLCSFNKATLVALCKVGKPGMGPTEVQMMALQHVHNGKDVLVWLLTARASPLLSSYRLYSASINFGRAEVAYCLKKLGSHGWHGELHIAIVYFTEYFPTLLSASLAYSIDKLYREQNCLDMHEQWIPGAPLPFFECLRTRLR